MQLMDADAEKLEYITMTWHYAGKEYPKHCVGIVIEDSEGLLKIQKQVKLLILDKDGTLTDLN